MKIDETEKNYITDKLFLYNNKIYFEKGEKYIKINDYNWSQFLKDYGWIKLDIGWRKRLSKDKKSNYGLLDCGANGDCLFHCIAEAFNDPFDPKKCMFDIKYVREIAANEINEDNFDLILETYKLEEETDEFIGDWNPQLINSINDLKNEITQCGDSFWGDHIILQLLQQKLDFNVIILNSCDNLFDKHTIKPMASNINKYSKTIILYYIEGLHFQLVGYFNKNKMDVLFNNNNIPTEILNVYNLDCRGFS